MKRELKKSVVYALYGISFLFLLAALVIPIMVVNKSNKEKYDYVSKGILDYENEVKVVNTQPDTNEMPKLEIIKPFKDESVKVVKSFYDYTETNENQENSLIFYEGTYMQSSGVSYSKGEQFDVISILDGVVDSIKEDEIIGNSITIKHDNGIVSVYQSISDINVKKGDKVTQGTVIAKSSTSNISKDLENHLYFEIIINGINVNPEKYYGKNPSEL